MSIGTPSDRARIAAGVLFGGLVACTHSPTSQTGRTFSSAAPLEWCNTATSDATCRKLTEFVPPGSILQASVRGDFDNDGDEDILAVFARDADRSSTSPRGLLLLRRGEHRRLSKVLDNPTAILCFRCGGMLGDPLQEVRIGPSEITLRFEGGSRELWSSEYRFEYAQGRDLWLLTSIVHGGLDRTGGGSVERRLTPTDFGEVSMATFSSEDYPADALP